ncbi:MAG: hypothetical protein ACOYKD_08975 [Anaerolineaceae bacterium]|jgi:hypothetical protein
MSRFSESLKKAKNEKKVLLIASLPRNELDLAKAVLDAGVDVVKLHINVHHHASNTHFGSLAEERGNLEAILKVCEGVLTGIMPYAAPVNDPETFAELAEMGFDFYSQYLAHAVAGCHPPSEKIERMFALADGDPIEYADGLDSMPMDVCELSVMNGSTYGEPFTHHDLMKYAAIRARTNLPLVVPSQHLITPESTELIRDIGIEGLMIGAVVAGSTIESWKQSVTAFRKVIDRF